MKWPTRYKPSAVHVCRQISSDPPSTNTATPIPSSSWKRCGRYQPCNPIPTVYEATFDATTRGHWATAVRFRNLRSSEHRLSCWREGYHNQWDGWHGRSAAVSKQVLWDTWEAWAPFSWIKQTMESERTVLDGPGSENQLALMGFLNQGSR